ncbi:MAG: lipopolysaccharide assembly protein LapB [Gammaproteobacteria bacterium]|nr:lipopolysaccharide assembly protein LapB [Gammaproteobacteria bacterium]
MTEYLWLLLPLLPVAAASGWYAAKRDTRQQFQTDFHLPSAYFKGLNFLLNEQPDKAIEVFIKVLEVNPETVEMHLTLGNLFRRRGEVERATRIHQNLIARQSLSKNQRFQALFELAQDYLKAGLLDRAESLFQEISDVASHAGPALKYLSQIYEQEKEWQKAIHALRRLDNLSNEDFSHIVAHYYCELSETELQKDHLQEARSFVKKALAEDPNCTRATILLGETESRLGRHAKAIAIWRKIEQQDAHVFGEVVDKIINSYNELGDEKGLQEFLGEMVTKHSDPKVLLANVDELAKREGAGQAEAFLSQWLQKNPTVHGLKRLFELKRARYTNDDRDELYTFLLVVERLMDTENVYLCKQCGFSGRSLHWQCPGCKGWNTIEPIRSETRRKVDKL